MKEQIQDNLFRLEKDVSSVEEIQQLLTSIVNNGNIDQSTFRQIYSSIEDLMIDLSCAIVAHEDELERITKEEQSTII